MKQVLRDSVFFCILGIVWGQSAIEISRRVMNGEIAKIGQFPYHAIFMFHNKVKCGASVIHKRWALTAAHCLISNDTEAYTIVVGGINNIGNDGKKYAVEALVSHETYSSMARRDDIMLIRLKTNIEFNKNISYIKLPASNIDQYENNIGVLSGLGATQASPKLIFPTVMQFVHLRILPQTECRRIIKLPKIRDSHICSFNENKKGACVGDSGGAIVVNGTQIGLVSFAVGENCSIKNPTVNTRISSFLPWIEQKLSKYNDSLIR